jgi:glycosyltransferase involved in cell wall biosynthesis
MAIPLYAILGIPYNAKAVSYSCGEVIKGISSASFNTSLIAPRLNVPISSDIEVVQALPLWARWPVPYKFLRKYSHSCISATIRNIVLSPSANSNSVAYMWAFESIPLARELRRHGILTIWEKTNCHRGTAKRILDEAYGRVGLSPAHGITEQSVAHEDEFLAELDYVYCPSVAVGASLREHDVPTPKILIASYGWSPSRFTMPQKRARRGECLTFVFVGSVSIRKGAHLLLDYWVRSGIKARLLLAGAVEPAVARLCGHLLQREEIITHGYIEDIAAVYRSADVFVFPTLEEGAPLVTYEAAGCGLPVITTPMGAAGVIEDGLNGYILDPYDPDAWIQAFRKLADSDELRRSLGTAAQETARLFTWAQVGERRRNQLLEVFRGRPGE